MYPSTDFPRLKSMVKVITYVHYNPYSNVQRICKQCAISRATFYRFLHALKDLKVKIEYIKGHEGYEITDYGIIDYHSL